MITYTVYTPSVQQHWLRLLPNSAGQYDFANGSFQSNDMSNTAFRKTQNAKMWGTFEARQFVTHNLGVIAGYSSYVSGNTSAPSPVTTVFKSPKVKNPNLGWKSRKKTLAILMSDYAASEISVTRKPGVTRKQISYMFQIYSPSKYWTGLFQFSVNGRNYIKHGDVYYFLRDTDTYMYGEVWRTETVYGSLPPLPEDPEKLLHLISLSREKSIELITATVADANRNSVDVLTAAAEMPETVKETLSAMKSVITIIADVKKRRFDVSQTFLRRKEAINARYDKLLADLRSKQLSSNSISKKKKRLLERKEELLAKRRQRDIDKSAGELGNALANIWMWFRYSLSPTLYLIDDCLDALNALYAVYDTARSKEEVDATVVLKYSGFSDPKSDVSRTHRCVVKRRYCIDSATPRGLGQVMSANLATTGLELLSKSFVLDWFINLGDLITAALPTDLDYLEQSVCYSFKDVGFVEYVHNTSKGIVTYNFKSYERHIINPNDFLGLTFRPAMNLFRTIDSVAMLWPAVRNSFLKSKSSLD